MIATRLMWMPLTAALVVACKSGGLPAGPVAPTYRLIRPPPCLTAPPVNPGPVLGAAPLCAVDACPPLTPAQDAALWAYIDAIEGYAWRAWRACGVGSSP